MAYICNLGHEPAPIYTKEQAGEVLRQTLGRNVFYKLNDDDTYDEIAEDLDVDISGWSWTARFADLDNDADLDIIAVSFDGPIWIYTNNTRKHRGIIFELDDHKANRAGIGSRIIIHYGDDGSSHQIREIKASDGFLSYDAPRAHFGLGEHSVVSGVEVIWSTGEKSLLTGRFRAGHRYKIERT